MNREQWLTELGKRLEPYFRWYAPLLVGRYRVTCGWPCRGGLGRNGRRVVGECFAPECSAAGVHELFISPTLADTQEVAGTVAHEMAHVVAGVKAAHGRGFREVCARVGLTAGRPSQVMPGDWLRDEIGRAVLSNLPAYPHALLKPVALDKAARTSSVVVLECVGAEGKPGCGCRVTISRKWLARVGAPTCGCGLPLTPANPLA